MCNKLLTYLLSSLAFKLFYKLTIMMFDDNFVAEWAGPTEQAVLRKMASAYNEHGSKTDRSKKGFTGLTTMKHARSRD